MTHRGVKLRSKPRRLGVDGQPLKPPYHLDRWCEWCGMGLVAGEWHPLEACVVFVATRDYEKALRKCSSLTLSETL